MPITLPVLDDRNYEEILEEAVRRIPVYTPEWTNFESDPGLTVVQLFAFLTENLLYRANRIPERNRLKFLQLLNVPLLPASPAQGLVAIQNERGPVEPLLLEQGVVLAAGNVQFITRDFINVMPVQSQIYYKRTIASTDPAYATYREKYEAVLSAHLAAQADAEGLPFPGSEEFEALGITPQFYEPALLPMPKRGEPLPAFDLESSGDRSLYVALLAAQPEYVDAARRAIANGVLSIGLAPATDGSVPSLEPLQTGARRPQPPGLIFETPDLSASSLVPTARYRRLKVIQQMDVFNSPGLIMVELPDASQLIPWSFDEPLEEGTGDFPPRLEDDKVRERLVTWLRIRLPETTDEEETTEIDRRVAWVGINAARVVQAVPVVNENLGLGTGESDQIFALANTPAIPTSLTVAVEESAGPQTGWQIWRRVDDLFAAGPDDRVFTFDAESSMLRFGDGLRGRRPRGRVLASYEYGGGPQGNVSIGAVNASPDVRLQGGYKISNPIATTGGALGETAADGERRIPLYIRHRDRLVTLQDFRDVTRRTPGVNVGRVEVLPLFTPADPDLEAPGVVTVMALPQLDRLDPLWPAPDRLFLRRVCDHLDVRRLVTTEIYVRGPEYLPVYVSVGVQVRAGFFIDQVKQDAEMQLRLYLSALPPGGPEGRGWPLNKQLVRKELEAVVTRVPGIDYVESLQMGVTSAEDIPDYVLSGLELPRVAGISVRQGSAESLESLFAPPGSEPSLTETVPLPVSRAKC
jgi:hypothetical protein